MLSKPRSALALTVALLAVAATPAHATERSLSLDQAARQIAELERQVRELRQAVGSGASARGTHTTRLQGRATRRDATTAAAATATTLSGGTIRGDQWDVRGTEGNALVAVRQGAAEGARYGSFYVPNGDILNVRNIQGGFKTDKPDTLNLDLGAGASEPGYRGNIVLNYDVGRGFEIFDGSARPYNGEADPGGLVAQFNQTRDLSTGSNDIRFYRPFSVAAPVRAGATIDAGQGVTAHAGGAAQVALGPAGPAGQPGVRLSPSGDAGLYRHGPGALATGGRMLARGGIGVGNSRRATTLGRVVRKVEVFDAQGRPLGYVPVYNAIGETPGNRTATAQRNAARKRAAKPRARPRTKAKPRASRRAATGTATRRR